MNSRYKWGNKVRVQGLTPTSYMTLGKSIYLLNGGNSIYLSGCFEIQTSYYI